MFEVHTWKTDPDGLQSVRPFSDDKRKILEYVKELKKTGYEVLEMDPIEEHRKVYYTRIKLNVPYVTTELKKVK